MTRGSGKRSSSSRASSPSRPAAPRAPDGTEEVAFELIEIEKLRPHEQVELEVVDRVHADLQKEGRIREPILVSKEEFVVLNGHHRVAALTRLRARRVPAWVVRYMSEMVELDRYPGSTYPGSVTKKEVIAHALSARLFPPKTTRHRLRKGLPDRHTDLNDLM